MSTFEEIAKYARTVGPSQRYGGVDYCQMIAELAEAMHTLEYNLAVQLTHVNRSKRVELSPQMMERLIQVWLANLRAPLP